MLECWAEDIVHIADETKHDTVMTDTGEHADNEWINRSKLRVDTRKWLLSKLMPKKYGEKVEQTQIHEIGDTLKNEIARVRAQNGQ